MGRRVVCHLVGLLYNPLFIDQGNTIQISIQVQCNELAEPSSRTLKVTKESNELARRAELDLVEDDMERARIQEEDIKRKIVRKHKKKVNP